MKKLIAILALFLSIGMSAQNNYEFAPYRELWYTLNVMFGSSEVRIPAIEFRDTMNVVFKEDSADFRQCQKVLFSKGILPHTDTCSTTSGTTVFYLTNDGTNTGTALYPNGNIWPRFIINDVSRVYAYSWALSNSNRTLTVNVKYQDHDFMSGPYMTNAPNNTLVRMTITGN